MVVTSASTNGTGPAARRVRVHKLLEKLKLDAAVMTDQKNVCYLTGYLDQGPTVVPTYLVLLRDGTDVLVTGERKRSSVAKLFPDEIVTFQNYDLGSRMVAHPDLASSAMEEVIGRLKGITNLGVESWSASKTVLDSLEKVAHPARFTDLSGPMESMRMIKDADEVASMKESCKLVDYAYSVAESLAAPGLTEVELYAAVHQRVVEKAGGFQYFSGDFTTGEHGTDTSAGGAPTSLAIKKGDTLILDLWTTTKGYWADTCRTLLVGGNPTKEQLHLYEAVEKAMQAGMRRMRPGATGGDVYRAVKSALDETGYGKLFPHHAGHGVGLDPWERPYLIPGSEDIIEKGMVLALEPGAYLKGVAGVRLENNFLVEADGATSLSTYPLGW